MGINPYLSDAEYNKINVTVEIEKETFPPQLASEFTPESLRTTEVFKKGTEPTEISPTYIKLSNVTNLTANYDFLTGNVKSYQIHGGICAILTVGVVTKPFKFEGPKRASNAEKSMEEMSKYVESLVSV